jgi:hypothetical protein
MTFELTLFSLCLGALNGLAIGSLTLTLLEYRLQKQKQKQQIRIRALKSENG